jgi:hypothetical protein
MLSSSLYLTLELARDAKTGHCAGEGTVCCACAMPQKKVETMTAFTTLFVNMEILVFSIER